MSGVGRPGVDPAAIDQPSTDPSDAGTPDLLRRTADLAIRYRETQPDRPVGARPGLTSADLRAALGGPLPRTSTDAWTVVSELAQDVEPGLVGIGGPRYFGFVMGGSVPASLATDWLTSTWDQNVGLYLATPSAAIVEEVAAAWLVELLGLPAGTSTGFVTGATMANFTALAAARHAVLRRAGWDVEADGLIGAPPVRVIAGRDAHSSVLIAIRYLGLGTARVERVPTDDEGRMDPDALAAMLEGETGPTIVIAQAGEVNTGAFDALDRIVPIVRRVPGAWLHVDGAFGLWAATSARLRHLVAGHDQADSWATDAHKWLNVPYDAGLVFVRDAAAHRAAMAMGAAYLPPAPDQERDPFEYVPELSRRARGFPIYAAIRELGADGITALVERDCALARQLATRLANEPGIEVANEVVLNQVLVSFDGDEALTRDVIRRVQDEGTAWLSGTTFHGMARMRVSVSGWSTTETDIDRTADAIVRCLADARRARAADPG
ncbi:MAG: aspartate aminotransferase family protein [Chloroflexi bacterium]|nr:aspartate aminotransferase family protein [Chloroflexota bacterium]